MVALLTIGAVAALAVLAWTLYRRFGVDRIAELNDRRRSASRIVGRGEYIDGNRHLEVAMALAGSTLFYENVDMKAFVDLQWVREIEYDSALATGAHVTAGKILRLRSKSQTFEFLLPLDVVSRWHMMLPPRRPILSGLEPAAELDAQAGTA